MILTITELKEFLAICKNDIAQINYCNLVVDDSQMTGLLGEREIEENLLLFGVIPDYSGNSAQDDASMMDNDLVFLVVQKMEDSDYDHEDFLDVMQETLLAARELVKRIYQEKNNPDTCPKFYFLEEGSENISAVWKKAGCNGWMVSINLRTDL